MINRTARKVVLFFSNLVLISSWNFMLSWVEHEKLYTSGRGLLIIGLRIHTCPDFPRNTVYFLSLLFLNINPRLQLFFKEKTDVSPFSGIKKNHKIAFSCVTKGIIWKIYMQELWFLCMTHCLNVLYKCMKLRWNIFDGYLVIKQTRNSIANDQRVITPKISKAEFWFSCMTCRLNVPHKCMKFRWNISNGF